MLVTGPLARHDFRSRPNRRSHSEIVPELVPITSQCVEGQVAAMTPSSSGCWKRVEISIFRMSNKAMTEVDVVISREESIIRIDLAERAITRTT